MLHYHMTPEIGLYDNWAPFIKNAKSVASFIE